MSNLLYRVKDRVKNAFMNISNEPVSHSFQMGLVVVAALCGSWPYLVGYNVTALEASELRHSLNNIILYRESSVACVALLVPLLGDYIMDLVKNRCTPNDRNGQTNHLNVENLNDIERFVLLVGLVISPLVSFVPTTYPNLAQLWFCVTRFQIVAVFGSIQVSFTRFDCNSWPVWNTILGTAVLTIAINLTAYTSFQGRTGYGNVGSLNIVANILKGVALISAIIPSARWLIAAAARMCAWPKPNSVHMTIKEEFSTSRVRRKSFETLDKVNRNVYGMDHLHFTASYVAVGAASSATILLMLIFMETAANFTSNLLLVYNVVFIALEVMLLLYILRSCLRNRSFAHFYCYFSCSSLKNSSARSSTRASITFLLLWKIRNSTCAT